MLVTSIFSFSNNIFYSSQPQFQFLSHIILSSVNTLNLDQSNFFSFCKELNSITVVLCRIVLIFYGSIPFLREQPWERSPFNKNVHQHSFLFPAMFSSLSKNISTTWITLKWSFAKAFNLKKAKIMSSGKVPVLWPSAPRIVH